MHRIFLIFTIYFPLFLFSSEPKVCLNMIVKNESAVICRCLESVKPLIDYWVIVDTGSNDGTQAIIKEYMKDLPGELHERPWKNFGHNRNEALMLAKGKARYVLFIDADETLQYSNDFKLPELTKDFYYITTEYSGTNYHRAQLINNALDWQWIGVLHETVSCPSAKSFDVINGLINFVRTDGDRSKDAQKFQKDAQILEAALKEEPNNSRYVFYLAQSYRDSGDYEQAIKNYEKRLTMGGWDQEIFWSHLQIGLMKQLLKKEENTIVKSYQDAYFMRPSRAEPLYRLAHYYRSKQNFLEGYNTALLGLTIPCSKDSLFVEHWIYDYGLLMEFSICAYWLEKYSESLLSSHLLLTKNLPQNYRDCVQNNLTWIHSKLQDLNKSYKNEMTKKHLEMNLPSETCQINE
ncbi:hypothetical protein PHSC3_000470 [Chlamydiales bacterium STE3]|nr:hypothetical protein PHSC3_000470 [Chlamydiales bacterium STE3]